LGCKPDFLVGEPPEQVLSQFISRAALLQMSQIDPLLGCLLGLVFNLSHFRLFVELRLLFGAILRQIVVVIHGGKKDIGVLLDCELYCVQKISV
jgi:hypothetical protein